MDYSEDIPVMSSSTRESSPAKIKIDNKSKFNNNIHNNNNNNHNEDILRTPDTSNNKNIDGKLFRSSTICSTSKSPSRRHLRTLSITSNSSSTCNSTTNSTRKGINLGINLIPTSNNNINNNINNSINNNAKTPRRKLFIPKDNSVHINSPPLGEFANEQLLETNQRSSIETNNTDISSIINSSPDSLSPLKSDINPHHSHTHPHPHNNANLSVIDNKNDELSENFRLLASKEMEVLEIKNQIKYLLQKRREKEIELRELKLKVERQLMVNIKQQNIQKSPIKNNKIKNTNGNLSKPSNIDPLLDESFVPISTNNEEYNSSNNTIDNSFDKRQSWFAKPLNFIQQFDNLIYKEFEKLQIPDDELDENGKNNENDLIDIDYNDKSKEINAPIKSLAGDNSPSNDVMQSVSSHLWSFVNDVKANLLVEEDESENDNNNSNNTSNTINNNSINSINNDKSPLRSQNQVNRLRTASISKRQSYSQHNHKRRPSMTIIKNDSIDNDKKSDVSNIKNRDHTHDDKKILFSNTKQKETKSILIDNDEIQDSDLWDSEPLDI